MDQERQPVKEPDKPHIEWVGGVLAIIFALSAIGGTFFLATHEQMDNSYWWLVVGAVVAAFTFYNKATGRDDD